MKKFLFPVLGLLIIAATRVCGGYWSELEQKADLALSNNNSRDAFLLYKKTLSGSTDSTLNYPEMYKKALRAMYSAKLISRFDGFRSDILKKYGADPRMLTAIARSCVETQHFGYLIAGEFKRGYHRGGGARVSSMERDRAEALRLYFTALPAIESSSSRSDKKNFYLGVADALMLGRTGNNSWKLQQLTDLKNVPDYQSEPAYLGMRYEEFKGAPVDKAGKPVFYSVPSDFASAVNDGQRWRLVLKMTAENGDVMADYKFAEFLQSQFGVQTLGYSLQRQLVSLKSSKYAIQTLKENETIAKLADGVRRINLPDEFNFLKIYKMMSQGRSDLSEKSLDKIWKIYLNRRQYESAAVYLRQAVRRFGKGIRDARQKQLDQIEKNWGQILPCESFPAGRKPEIDFKFRNASEVKFKLFSLNKDDFFSDVRKYLTTKAGRELLFKNGLRPESIGNWLLKTQGKKYIGNRIAFWKKVLTPPKEHFDSTVGVELPVSKGGAYLLEAEVADGNTSRMIIWISDLAIVKRPVASGTLLMVTDALSGKPVKNATLNFFGYRLDYIKNQQNNKNQQRYTLKTDQFHIESGEDGTILLKGNLFKKGFQYMIRARSENRTAIMGFDYFYDTGTRLQKSDPEKRIYCITDRPIYRPGQTVNFKYWLRMVGYGKTNYLSGMANKEVEVVISSPRRKIFDKKLTTDNFGALDGSFVLPSDADLGEYTIYLKNVGGYVNFRVEEYRKPEFEVKVAAVGKNYMLGDKMKVKIHADYFFGAPVKNALVRYKVFRSAANVSLRPPAPWEWLYGKGYDQLVASSSRVPGFEWAPSAPPELVLDSRGTFDKNGELIISVDTSLAREIYGDSEQQYRVVAEVTDQSRHTQTGETKITLSSKPFQVTCSTGKGFYNVGDIIKLDIRALDLQSNIVTGEYSLDMFRVSYDKAGNPTRKLVKRWSGKQAGKATILQFKINLPGHYLIEAKVKKGNKMSTASTVIRCIGASDKDSTPVLTSLPLEFALNAATYKPGDKLQLLISGKNPDQTVYLFVRPSSTQCNAPRIIRLKDGSAVVNLDITRADMPNIFIDGIAVCDGKVTQVVKQITVPPEKKSLKVKLSTTGSKHEPRSKCPVSIQITDYQGNPVTGQVVLTIYDKPLDALAGGSNIPSINKFFWDWKRYWSTRLGSSLSKHMPQLIKPGEVTMQPLGLFGYLPTPQPERGNEVSLGGKMRMAAMPEGENLMVGKAKMADSAGKGAAAESGKTVVMREDFADTVVWQAAIKTDSNGNAVLPITLPDNLTTWVIRAWAITGECQVGQGEAQILVSKDYIARLEIPRFLNAGDTAIVSAIIHNRTKLQGKINTSLEVTGGKIQLQGTDKVESTILPEKEVRIDWKVRALEPGQGVLLLKSTFGNMSDGVKLFLPINVKGIKKQNAYSGYISNNQKQSAFVALDIPEDCKPDSTRLIIQYSPSIAASMVDALPYLAEESKDAKDIYSALNSFLPSLAAYSAVKQIGVDISQLQKIASGLNPVEIGAKAERVKEWRRLRSNPVFNQKLLDSLVRNGLKTITAMQNSDGGWGWFSGFSENSAADTTAYCVDGLLQAKDNYLQIDRNILNRGVEWLQAWQNRRNAAFVKAVSEKSTPQITELDSLIFEVLTKAGKYNKAYGEILYKNRSKLNVYGLSNLALAFKAAGDKEKLSLLMQNIEQFVVEDAENQTAYLRMSKENYWWNWFDREIVAQANYLNLLAATDPDGKRAAWLAKYLVVNRKNDSRWGSVRETGSCVSALANYIKNSSEGRPDMTLSILYDGKVLRKQKITAANMFGIDKNIVLDASQLASGKHSVEIRRDGKGPVYFNLYLSYFSLEDFIGKTGLDLKISRQYFKLEPVNGTAATADAQMQPLAIPVEKYRRVPINDMEQVKSGDLIEIEMDIKAKNDYEYVVISDGKPAGFEPVNALSGYTGNELGAFVEQRDTKVNFYVRNLARGSHSVSYRMRAVTPGKFSALPAIGTGVYAPELRCNSNEFRVVISD
ncbi:MG2 domain-containing protein [Lentisphaerota bacterium ZTH]|nr:hypothetical protein JYG24_02585 [Lentisphaerota bacterium]WET07602.1 MG2 domain-containing protein [Lentisphaerota bacterium ZTH]